MLVVTGAELAVVVGDTALDTVGVVWVAADTRMCGNNSGGIAPRIRARVISSNSWISSGVRRRSCDTAS